VLLRTERAAYRVGETLKAEVLTTVQSGAIYLDLVKDQQTIAALRAIQDGRAAFAVDLDTAMFGTLELHAYVVMPNTGIARDTRLVVVDQAQEVNVGIGADREVYRPGQTARMAMTTTLQGGQPIQSALGIGIVDESVFAVEDQAPGFARLYFLLEKELLEPKVDVKGFDVPTLLSSSTPPQVIQAQDKAAKASWAGGPVTNFAFDIRSRLQKLSDLASQKVKAFIRLSGTLSKTLILLPVLALIVLIWGLRPSGVLGKAVRTVDKWTVLAILVAPFCAIGLYVGLWFANAMIGPLAVILAALVWLAAWVTFAIYAWRNQDPRAQLMAGLTMAYTLLGVLMAYVAENGGDLQGAALTWTVVTFIVMIFVLVIFGQGLRFEGKRPAAWASPGRFPVAAIVIASALSRSLLFVQSLSNPVAYLGRSAVDRCSAATPAPRHSRPSPPQPVHLLLLPPKRPRQRERQHSLWPRQPLRADRPVRPRRQSQCASASSSRKPCTGILKPSPTRTGDSSSTCRWPIALQRGGSRRSLRRRTGRSARRPMACACSRISLLTSTCRCN
jgi:hypothetical protein